jgi:D-xylose transport system substrate-binding protein
MFFTLSTETVLQFLKLWNPRRQEMTKKIVGLLLVTAMIFGLAQAVVAGGRQEVERPIRIGISFGTLQQERWTREREMMEAYAADMGGIEILVQSADSDATLQNQQVENLITQGVDVLIIVPHDAEASAAGVREANDAGIPVIAYDRMINNANIDVYVSFDSVKVGELMAEYALQETPTGNYVILKGGPTDNNAHLVYEGHMNVLQAHVDRGAITIVSDQWCNDWSPQEALQHTENALTANNNDVQAILTGWDGLAGAAIQALAAEGLDGKVTVTGQDADLSACRDIVEGKQTMTVYKPLSELALAGVQTAVALARGERIEYGRTVNNGFKDVPSVLPEIYAVNADNMVEIIIDSGFHSLEDVYANVPRSEWPR